MIDPIEQKAAVAPARRPDVFVGREQELAGLRSALDQSAKSVMISGPLGSGKSRLIKEAALHHSRHFFFTAHIWSRSMQPGLEPWTQLVEQVDAALINAGIAPEPAVPLQETRAFAARFTAASNRLHLETGRPIAVVVECLHLADISTLDILRRLAESACIATIVATARTDVPVDERRRIALDAYCDDAHHVELGGLDRRAIETWADVVSAGPIDFAGLLRATGGLPLLIEAELSGSPSPQHRVHSAVHEMLESLGTDDRTVANAASIAIEIDAILLEDILCQLPQAIAASLEKLAELGLLVRDPVQPGGFRFPHELQRLAVAATIESAEQARIHWSIADALSGRHGASVTTVHRVALHAGAGIAAGDPDVAIAWLQSSAQVSNGCWDLEAAEHTLVSAFEIARNRSVNAAKRREILADLVLNRQRQCHVAAEDTARMLAAEARRSRDPRAAAIAAIGMARLPIGLAGFTGADPSVVNTQQAAFNQLDDSRDHQLRAHLACSLIVNGEGRISLGQRLALLQVVRDCADREPTPVAVALVELGEAALEHGPIRTGDAAATMRPLNMTLPSDLAIGLVLRDGMRMLRRGHCGALRSELATVADDIDLASRRWAMARLHRAVALAEGDADLAAASSDELRRAAAGTTLINVCINDERAIGRPNIDVTLPGYTTTPASNALAYLPYRARLAATMRTTRPDHARDLLASVMRHDAASMLTSRHRVPTFAYLGRCAAALGDRQSCERVIEALLPFADEWVVVAHGAMIDGSVASVIADAAQTIGATRLADEMRVKARHDSLGSPKALPVPPPPNPTPSPSARRSGCELRSTDDGASWELTFDGDTKRVPPSRGLELLARLLEHGGLAVPAAVLEAGPTVDAYIARARRLRDLQDDIDSANDHNDDERRIMLQRRFDDLLDELVRTERGDHDRNRERARIRVTKALRATLGRLATIHPRAGEHLVATIETGRLCRYSGTRTWTMNGTK